MKTIKEKDITVIVPVHVWDNEIVKPLLGSALKSCQSGVSLIIVKGDKVDADIKDEMSDVLSGFSKVSLVEVTGNTGFQHMVNEGVKAVKTDWFSILEFDDEYSPIWFNNFVKYQKYNQQYNFFLYLNDLYSQEDGKDKFVGNGNEAAWAASFSDKEGVIDEAAVTDFFDFYLNGGIFNTEAWNKLGGLKENIKLTFWYEWIMRATHSGENLYVVPKVGYAHVIARKGSLMDEYRSTIDAKESDFWYKAAKREAYKPVDNSVEIVYKPE